MHLTRIPFIAAVSVAAVAASITCSPSMGDGDADGDGDGDADTDGDGDGDADTDADADGDGDEDGDGDGDADTDADGDGDGDSDTDSDLDDDFDLDFDDVCDSQEFEIAMEPVRVMILLDESSSMGSALPWLPGSDHWDEATAGLQHLLEDRVSRNFYFGLDAFPDGTTTYFEGCYLPCCPLTCPFNPTCLGLMVSCNRGCSVDLPPIVTMDRAALSGPQIIDYMGLTYLPGTFTSTPLLRQMQYYQADHSAEMADFYSGDGKSYLVVVSDGEDTCDVSEGTDIDAYIAQLGTVTADVLATRGIRSFAIGFGDTSGTMAEELNAIASNGGTPFTEFFPITADGALVAALDAISSEIVSCVYDIEEPDATADPDSVNFYFDGVVVGYDDACVNGWRWTDATHLQVEFCGATCDQLSTGVVERIEARFGCDTIVW
jgi:hypothetical protein